MGFFREEVFIMSNGFLGGLTAFSLVAEWWACLGHQTAITTKYNKCLMKKNKKFHSCGFVFHAVCCDGLGAVEGDYWYRH